MHRAFSSDCNHPGAWSPIAPMISYSNVNTLADSLENHPPIWCLSAKHKTLQSIYEPRGLLYGPFQKLKRHRFICFK